MLLLAFITNRFVAEYAKIVFFHALTLSLFVVVTVVLFCCFFLTTPAYGYISGHFRTSS